MGRRSLPKIKGSLELSRYFIPLLDEYAEQGPYEAETAELFGAEGVRAQGYDAFAGMSFEALSERLFGRVAPTELEIGSGKGLFIAAASKRSPERNFIGVELAYRSALTSASRLAKQNTPNGVMFSADAARVLRDIIPLNSLVGAHIYFPDPWWKKAHRKRRIVRPDVIQMIEERLVVGGKLHFWTDVEEYFKSGVETIKLSSNLAGPFDIPERKAEGDLDYLTHFERRTRLNEAPVYRSYFVKRIA